MEIARWFTQHPASVGESYPQHLRNAATFGIVMMLGGLACLVHAILPFLFERTASRCIQRLHQRMVVSRSNHQHSSTQFERG
jgi:hypothetical protein